MNWKDAFTRASQAAPDFGAAGGALPGASALVDGATARAVQARLNALGAQPLLTVDGSWGPKSAAATASFQSSRNLKADGIPGLDTLRALGVPIPPAPKVPNVPGLKKSVVAAFPLFNGKFEGQALPYMYTDSKGYVTTGTGNLIDPVSEALKLPWKNSDGSAASASDITAAFNAVKNGYPSVQSTASQSLSSIRLNPDDLNALLYGKMAQNHAYFTKAVPGYVDAPAPAQLGTHSSGWAWGPGFAHVWDTLGRGNLGTQFLQAMATKNYAAIPNIIAQANVHEESINAGIIPRNAAAKELYMTAADVVSKKADYDSLYWPGPVVTGALKAVNTVFWVLGGVSLAVGLVVLAAKGGK